MPEIKYFFVMYTMTTNLLRIVTCYLAQPQPYSFQYEVVDPPSGNDYSQRESSDGNVVQGEYRVLLPDSRTQIVRYTADNVNGYNAEVQYEGQARAGGGYPGGGYGGGYQGGWYIFNILQNR